MELALRVPELRSQPGDADTALAGLVAVVRAAAGTPSADGATPGRNRTPTAAIPDGRTELQPRVSGPQIRKRPPSIHSRSRQPSGTRVIPPVPVTSDHEHATSSTRSAGAARSR